MFTAGEIVPVPDSTDESCTREKLWKNVCASGILPSIGENEEWWSRAIGVNERVYMLCESMNYIYLDVWEDFVDSFKLY